MLDKKEPVVIDHEQLSEYVASKIGVDAGVAADVLDCEMDFLTEKGIAGEGGPPETEVESVYVDADELLSFIVARLRFDSEMVSMILDAEMEYLEEKGVAFRI